jgi:predicted nucleotide-binding protein (sugar kinase/HSP70/actin superfamily)
MNKFCVIKSTIPDEEGCAIINQDDIKLLVISKHPRTKQEVYQIETPEKAYYFTEFVTKEANLQEAVEYFHSETYRDR